MIHNGIFSVFLWCVCWCGALPAQVYTLDFGEEKNDDYQHPAGFEWIDPPIGAFYTPGYGAWRPPEWLDGVVGPDLHWQMTLPDGDYELQLFLSTGLEMTSTWKIAVQDETSDNDLHPVRGNPVPTKTINPQVKIWRGPVSVAGGQLEVKLTGGEDSIRLLAAHIIRQMTAAAERGPRHTWLLEMLHAYGRFDHNPLPLEPLLDNLFAGLRQDPQDAWAFKYYQEASWLHLAEKLKNYRGWQWSTNRHRMSMIQKFQQAVMLLEPIVQQDRHPLYERALWLRIRLMHHLYLEYGHEPDNRIARQDLKRLRARFPRDTLLRMYSGELFPNPFPDVVVHPAAPAWSKAQVIALERLRRLVHYWVLDRQAPNGEMGGKYGDDVEALRFWYPLFYTGDSIAILGLKRLADGVWYSDEVANGFAKNIDDVEHSSEFISDTAPLLIAASDNPQLHRRALPTAYLMDTLWTGLDPEGDLFFRSSWYSSRAIDERPPRNRDLAYNTRTTKVLRYYLWRYPDDDYVRDLLYRWTKSWVKLAAGTEKGKPKGLLPASYRLSDGAVNGDENNWYEANMFWAYYDFRGDVMLLDQMLFLWQFTRDEALLYPVEAVFQLVDKYREAGGEPGSPGWAAARFARRSGFGALAGQWRILTGRTDYDSLIVRYGSPYIKYRINGDTNALLKGLENLCEDLNYNWPMQTSDAWFTDRIPAADSTAFRRLASDILKAMLTGDMIHGGTSPYMAVTWHATQKGFSALVEDHSRSHLRVALFNHAAAPQSVIARLWGLDAGRYTVTLNGEPIQEIAIEEAGHKISLDLPPGRLTELSIAPRPRPND